VPVDAESRTCSRADGARIALDLEATRTASATLLDLASAATRCIEGFRPA
jgi:hypothetical protein